MHLRAVRALQIVEPYNHHRSIRRAATRRPPSSLTICFGSWLMSYLLNCASVLPSVREQKCHWLARMLFGRKCDANRIVAGNIALRARSNLDLIVRRNARPRPDQNLHPPRQVRRQLRSRRRRWSLCVAAEGRQGKGKDKDSKRSNSNQHLPRLSHAAGFPAPRTAFHYSSKQSFRPPQIARRPDVRQREIEPVGVLISHRPQFILPILHAESAAVPVIRGL